MQTTATKHKFSVQVFGTAFCSEINSCKQRRWRPLPVVLLCFAIFYCMCANSIRFPWHSRACLSLCVALNVALRLNNSDNVYRRWLWRAPVEVNKAMK